MPMRSPLREDYERIRSRRCAAGRHAYTLLVTLGMAQWVHDAAKLLPARETMKPRGPSEAGAARTREDEPVPGAVPGLVPLLAGLVLGSLKGGAR